VDQREYKMLHDTGDDMHGYGFVDRTELRRSNGTATYYGFNSRRGFRFISLDTVADGGCSCGNIDDPQYRWLKRELDRNSSREFSGRRLVRDRDRDRLIVVYGHHTLRSMSTTVPDEEAGECRADYDPGCDRDPRRSRPIHRGLAGRATIRDLLLRYPNVIAYVAGHTHKADLTPYARPGGASGFWEINTPSDADFPQQSRLIEILDNRDGTFSIFGTLLDHAAPIDPPMPGTPGSVFTEPQLASLSRVLAANDPQGLGPRGEGRDGGGARRRNAGRGRRNDRNAELLIRDPRLLGD
jgi:hypothetical protein